MIVNWIKDLEKRKIISAKPHPAIPFILGFVALFLALYISEILNINNLLSLFLYFLAGFTFIFAILHWIVVRIIKK